MGFTYVNVVIKGQESSREIKMLVDTGSTYIVLDPKSIRETGLLETPYKVSLTLADGRTVQARLFLAEVESGGRRGPAFVAEVDIAKPLLGVYSLETLGFKINPRTGTLEEMAPEGGYLLFFSHIKLSLPSSAKFPLGIMTYEYRVG